MVKNKYRNYSREEQNARELEELLKAQEPQVEATEEKPEEIIEAPKVDWEKRYSDLRREETKLRKDLSDKEFQLSQATKQQIRYPSDDASDEEVDAWIREYPDVSRVVDAIAARRTKVVEKKFDERERMIKEQEEKAYQRELLNKFRELHPDFDVIKETQTFKSWLTSQPRVFAETLNGWDVEAAARIIDIYKAEVKRNKRSDNQQDTRDAALVVKTSNPPQISPVANGLKFTESMVAKMGRRETEFNWPQIEIDMMKPGFYDISGAAR